MKYISFTLKINNFYEIWKEINIKNTQLHINKYTPGSGYIEACITLRPVRNLHLGNKHFLEKSSSAFLLKTEEDLTSYDNIFTTCILFLSDTLLVRFQLFIWKYSFPSHFSVAKNITCKNYISYMYYIIYKTSVIAKNNLSK